MNTARTYVINSARTYVLLRFPSASVQQAGALLVVRSPRPGQAPESLGGRCRSVEEAWRSAARRLGFREAK